MGPLTLTGNVPALTGKTERVGILGAPGMQLPPRRVSLEAKRTPCCFNKLIVNKLIANIMNINSCALAGSESDLWQRRCLTTPPDHRVATPCQGERIWTPSDQWSSSHRLPWVLLPPGHHKHGRETWRTEMCPLCQVQMGEGALQQQVRRKFALRPSDRLVSSGPQTLTASGALALLPTYASFPSRPPLPACMLAWACAVLCTGCVC
jgi:hypothetical protein